MTELKTERLKAGGRQAKVFGEAAEGGVRTTEAVMVPRLKGSDKRLQLQQTRRKVDS